MLLGSSPKQREVANASANKLGLGSSGKITITIFLISTIMIVIISRY